MRSVWAVVGASYANAHVCNYASLMCCQPGQCACQLNAPNRSLGSPIHCGRVRQQVNTQACFLAPCQMSKDRSIAGVCISSCVMCPLFHVFLLLAGDATWSMSWSRPGWSR